MGGKKYVIMVEPPSASCMNSEQFEFHLLTCPDCRGRGNRVVYVNRKDAETVPCERCAGTGKLKAVVDINYLPEDCQ
ncbi:MAG: hypothetical protein MdMp024_0946 [Bacteroidales bacterium]